MFCIIIIILLFVHACRATGNLAAFSNINRARAGEPVEGSITASRARRACSAGRWSVHEARLLNFSGYVRGGGLGRPHVRRVWDGKLGYHTENTSKNTYVVIVAHSRQCSKLAQQQVLRCLCTIRESDSSSARTPAHRGIVAKAPPGSERVSRRAGLRATAKKQQVAECLC